MKHLFRFPPSLEHLYQGQTITNHIKVLNKNVFNFLSQILSENFVCLIIRPVSGTSVGLIILLICSMLVSSGLNPPCMQNILSSTIAATGRQLKQSVNVFHNFTLYLRLPIDSYKIKF
jgi:hypothetical protein